jgi:DNA-binding NtrC family response regulator
VQNSQAGRATVSAERLGGPSRKQIHYALYRLFPLEFSVTLRPGTVLLGRAPGGGGLAFEDDAALSRQHLELSLADGVLTAKDLGSHNGSFRNGAPIVGTEELADGDLLRCGDSFFLYRVEPGGLLDAKIASIVGQAPVVRRLRGEIAQFAPTRTTVLLLGPTGTGKTLAARAIHELSGRKGEFVHVNAAAIPENVAESLLFGHKPYAFTDAKTESPGWFRSAHRGTLFLDEVGLLSPATQARLLLAVESRTVTPLGASRPEPVDVRLVAATNEDLAEATAEGRFREDLYARLAEATLTLPSLRSRREDVLPLLRTHLPGAVLAPGLVERLLLWDWPLNVRELEKVAIELRVRGEGLPRLGPELLDERFGLSRPAQPPPTSVLAQRDGPPNREELEALLRNCGGNVSELARRVGRSTKQVYRWCQFHGLKPEKYRST